MKILVISQYFFPENFRINDLCYGLSEMGHKVTVLTAKPNYPGGKFFKGYSLFNNNFEQKNGIDIYRSLIIPRGNSSGISLFINYISFVFFGIFRILTIRGKFDKIFIYAPSPITVGFLGVFASFIFKAKSYLWVHDLWPESVKDAGGINNSIILEIINFMTKTIYYFTDSILVQSPSFKEYIINQGVNKSKLIYYPYYAENFYKKVTPPKKIKLLFPEGLNILFAGNIGVAQSFDTILHSAKILAESINNFTFIILGEGRDKKRIQEEIKKMKIEKHFNFLGSHPPEEMSNYFACADALLVSLRDTKIFSYTIPGKLQSYLACGRPIIASLNGIGAKIIDDSQCGFISRSEDPTGLADSILSLNKLNEQQKERLGNNAIDYYEKEFERTHLLNRLINIFEE